MSEKRPEGDEATVQLCSFSVGSERYVLDIMRIREIVNPMPITPVRRGTQVIEGVIDLRGQIIPIVDLRARLGLPPQGPGRGTKYVIVQLDGKLLGLIVDAMGRVLVAPRKAIQPAPGLVQKTQADVFPGVLNHNGDLYMLIDLRPLLEDELDGVSAQELLRDRERSP